MKVKRGEIYKDDAEQTYVIREVFDNTCVVCPLVNKGCYACEIMEFSSMEDEEWELIGTVKK